MTRPFGSTRQLTAQARAFLAMPEEDLLTEVGRFAVNTTFLPRQSVVLYDQGLLWSWPHLGYSAEQKFRPRETRPKTKRRAAGATQANQEWLKEAEAELRKEPSEQNALAVVGRAFIRTNSTVREFVCEAQNRKVIRQALNPSSVGVLAALIEANFTAGSVNAMPAAAAMAVVILRLGLNKYCQDAPEKPQRKKRKNA